MKFELLPQIITKSHVFNQLAHFYWHYCTFLANNLQNKLFFFFYFKKFKIFYNFIQISKIWSTKKLFSFWENFFFNFSDNINFSTSFVPHARLSGNSRASLFNKTSKKKNNQFFSSSVRPITSNKLPNLQLIFFLFKFFFLFNNSFSNTLFFGNTIFSNYGLVTKGEKILILNYKLYLNRWLTSYDLIFNLSYFNISKLFFTSPLFYNQNNALNWFNFTWTFELWHWFQNLFIFQTPRHDPKVRYFFSTIKKYNVSCAIITDTNYHLKTIFYLKKSYFFTIGLIHLNENPFLVEYPVISFFNNYLIQSFFIKFIFFIQKQSNVVKIDYYSYLWQNSKQLYWI